uniref:Minor tail protein n=1 Tax=Siphoviridae sp. ctt8434 TaxID=2825703 RepID=A0A8S5U1F5_9CAUD|nr:MAG TPA: minor tail protein [Siphoviridae sp. ctt8434]
MDGKVIIGCDLDTRSFDAQIDYVENQMQEIEDKLKQADMGFEVGDTQKLEANYEKLGIKLDSLRKKQAKLNQEQAQMGKLDLSGVQTGIDNVNKGLTKTVKKVAKWGLAIFGVRSAYMAVRSAMNTISQYEDGTKNNIDYIKYALAYTLKPIVEWILNAVVKLLQYINYIAKAWTGKNLFKTADAFNKAKKGAKDLNKELQKTTASFDEINVLQDTKSSVGGVDITVPNIDLTSLQGKVPKWIDFIVKRKNEILAVMSGVAVGLLAWQAGLSGIKSLGIGLAIAGIIYTIESIIKYLKDPTFENFVKILEGITIAVIGVAVAFAAWPVVIGGIIALIVLEIVKNFEKIKGLFDLLIKWLDDNVLGALRNLFGPLGDILYMPIKFFVEMAKEAFEDFYGGIKTVIDGVMKIFKGDFLDGIKSIFGGLLSIMTAPLQGFVKGVIGVWNQIKETIHYWKDEFKRNFEKIRDFFMKPINDFIDGIKNLWSKIKGSIEDLGKKISEKLNPGNIFNNIGKGIGNVGKGIKKFFGFAKGGIVVPKLASGGIINQPGRGVPLVSAIGGERGQEGVVPLTDSQQMALLGEAIGKYVRIDNVIDVNMDSRRINRILQSSNDRVNFANNR